MNLAEQHHLKALFSAYPALLPIEGEILAFAETLIEIFKNGGRLYVGGNGGSFADAEHIVGECMKGFLLKRPLTGEEMAALVEADEGMGAVLSTTLQRALPAIALGENTAFTSAFGNDCDPVAALAQEVFALGRKGDGFLAISTSGNSENLILAATAARARGMKVLLLTGENGGTLYPHADVAVRAPQKSVERVQELHLPIYHAVCAAVEEALFGGEEHPL